MGKRSTSPSEHTSADTTCETDIRTRDKLSSACWWSGVFYRDVKFFSPSYAPVICNHCPPPSPPKGDSGDNDFSSIRTLLKALHCGDLLRVIALLFIRVNFTGIYLHNITRPAFTRYCGGTQKVIAHTLALLSPAHPSRWGGQGLQMTGALCLTWLKMCEIISTDCKTQIIIKTMAAQLSKQHNNSLKYDNN